MRLTTGTHFTPTHCSGQFLTLFSLIKVAGADPEKGGGGVVEGGSNHLLAGHFVLKLEGV